jgi:hypothetical protein
MDSFTIVFPTEISIEALTDSLQYLDENLTISIQDDDTIFVAKSLSGDTDDEAHIWIGYELALQKLGVNTLLNISVRRNSESSLLAVHVAGIFSKTLGGVISWDGMDYWEALFRRELGSPKQG